MRPTQPTWPLSGVVTTSFAETYAGDNLVAVAASSSGSAPSSGSPFPGGQRPCSHGDCSLFFSVAETAEVSIDAQMTGGDGAFVLGRVGGSPLIDVGPGIESVNQAVIPPAGDYGSFIFARSCIIFETLPSSSSFTYRLNVTFNQGGSTRRAVAHGRHGTEARGPLLGRRLGLAKPIYSLSPTQRFTADCGQNA